MIGQGTQCCHRVMRGFVALGWSAAFASERETLQFWASIRVSLSNDEHLTSMILTPPCNSQANNVLGLSNGSPGTVPPLLSWLTGTF